MNHSFADLTRACAELHGLKPAAVRQWRRKGNKKWLDFLRERGEAAATIEQAIGEPRKPAGNGEVGLREEISRLERECLQLHHRAEAAQARQDLTAELSIHKLLDSKRETLRRLSRSTPTVEAENAETLPRAETEAAFVSFCAQIRARLDQLPDRVLSFLPNEIGPEVREKVLAEVLAVQRSARGFKLSE